MYMATAPLTCASVPLVAVRLKPSETEKTCIITTMPIMPISSAIITSISVKPAWRAAAAVFLRVMASARIEVRDGDVAVGHDVVRHAPGDRDRRHLADHDHGGRALGQAGGHRGIPLG